MQDKLMLVLLLLPPTVALISYLRHFMEENGEGGGVEKVRGQRVVWSLLRVETISYANVNLMSR